MSTILAYPKKAWAVARRRPKTSIAILVVLLIGGVAYAASGPRQPTYVTAKVVKGDLVQTVEAVGTVVSERDLRLQFPMMDVVASVSVREGDNVKAGQVLAALRAGSLAASVASASANLQSAVAQMQALEQGSRPEDIAIYEAQVANKRASLDGAKQTLKNAEDSLKLSEQKLASLRSETSISLSGEVATASSTITQQLAVAKTAMITISSVFNSNDIQDAVIKSGTLQYELMRKQRDAAELAIDAAQQHASTALDYQSALRSLEASRLAVGQSSDALNRAYDVVSALATTSYLTNTGKETHLATLAAQRTSMQAALAKLDAAIKSLRDASANFDTRIITEESTVSSLKGTRDKAKADITTYETSLRIDQAQLDLKRAPPRQTDVDAARARVRQAQADVARASAQYNDTILRAPVDGVITKVSVKAGEMRPADSAVTMLGDSPYRIEMFVSEIDVPKVLATQSGSIELDAFRGTNFQLYVSDIDAAPTDRDGVSKYRVKLDFRHTHDELKIGMTGDARIITGMRQGVMSVPQRAVLDNADGAKVVRILKPDGKTVEERTVQTGMDAEGGYREVSGVEEGETVIVLITN